VSVVAAPTRKARPILVEAERVLLANLAALRPYMDDSAVNEIMVNSPETVFVEARGEMRLIENLALGEKQIESCLHAIMRLNAKEISPIMDARLPGFRIAAALPPVAIHGPMLVIRKHASRRFKLDEYVQSGAFNVMPRAALLGESTSDVVRRQKEEAAGRGGSELADFLRWAVETRKNILVAGGTSSGKTTFISSMMLHIPAEDRIITCEDTNELVLEQPNVVQLEALASDDPAKNISIRNLIRLCLRSRPDRIIVGELRGPEAYDFLDAMNTGHSGSVCTIHANSAFLGLRRLESLIRMSPTAANLPLRDMRSEIASAIDYVIYQSRLGGVRAPQEILALSGVDDGGDYVSRLIFSRVGE
jgi:P-type DNA transfer ATPase VirB11